MPARLKDLRRVMADFGLGLDRPSSGSHWKWQRQGSRPYTVPADNALKTEITDNYIKGMCRHFGIEHSSVLAALGQETGKKKGK